MERKIESPKNDRLKPLAYAGIAAKIWVKPNRAYTDHPAPGAATLYEMRTGIRLESNWNPIGIPTEPNGTNRFYGVDGCSEGCAVLCSRV